jgi:hypothetical protein
MHIAAASTPLARAVLDGLDLAVRPARPRCAFLRRPDLAALAVDEVEAALRLRKRGAPPGGAKASKWTSSCLKCPAQIRKRRRGDHAPDGSVRRYAGSVTG